MIVGFVWISPGGQVSISPGLSRNCSQEDSQATYRRLGKLSTICLEFLGTEFKDSMETSIPSLVFGNHLLAACCLSSAGVCIREQS